jgi:O-antigen ligase
MRSERARHRWKLAAQIALAVLIIAIPWQARWIIVAGELQGDPWEFATRSLYVTDLLWLIAFLIWIGYERTQPRGTFWLPSFRRALLGFGILAGLALLLSPWALHPDIALARWLTWMEGIFLFVMVVKGPLNLVRMSILVVLSALVQAALGLVQFWHQTTWATTWLGMAAHPAGAAGTAVIEGISQRWLRIYGMMDHPNILAGWFGLAVLLACGLMLEEGFRPRRGHGIRLWFLWGSLITITWAFFLTFSRSSIVACGVIFLGMLWVLGRRKLLQPVHPSSLPPTLRTTVPTIETWMFRRLLRVGWVVLVLGVLLLLLYPQPFLTRMNASARLESRSLTERRMQWREGWTILAKRPIEGVGLGNAAHAVVEDVDPDRRAWEAQPMHNIFFLAWIELGILGLAGWIFLWGELLASSSASLRSALSRSSRAGLLVGVLHRTWGMVGLGILLFVLLTSQTDHFWWSLHSGQFMFFLAVGIAVRANLTD